MAGTKVYAVRKWIADSLDALPAFDGVLVTSAWLAGSMDAEKVYSRQGRFHHEPAAMHPGATPRDESGSFQQVIRVEGVGKTLDETIARAIALGTAFEEWLAANRSPGAALPGVHWVQVEGDGGLDDRFNEAGSLVLLAYPVMFRARLSEV